jgi:hypothetical protein
MMNAGTSWVITLLYLVAMSVLQTWLFVQTGGSLVIVILHHAAANFFVFLNGGIGGPESLILSTILTGMAAAALAVLYGPNLRRGAAQSGPDQMLATASAERNADR